MQVEQTLVFAARSEQPAIEIRINFGVFAGRDATAAELEELARLIVPEVGQASIVSEQRHEVAGGREVVLHTVRIEVARDQVTPDEESALTEKLCGLAEIWARSCIAERHADIADL